MKIIAALLLLPLPAFAQTPAGQPAPPPAAPSTPASAPAPKPPPAPVPVARLSATVLGFGNVIYGGNPASQGVTLGNVGTAPMQIQGIAISGNADFTTTNNCGTALAPGSQCSLSIHFTPRALGARTGTLAIRTNADGAPHKVQMSGTGCRYFSPAAARFFLTSC